MMNASFAVIKNSQNIPKNLQNAVVAIGNFDGVHLGHQYLLNKVLSVAQKFNVPPIVLTFEPHPITLNNNNKKLYRLTDPTQKYKILRILGFAGVIEQQFDNSLRSLMPEQFVRHILCDNLNILEVIVGHDFRFGSARSGDSQILEQFGKKYGFAVQIVEPQKTKNQLIISSSRIRLLLGNGKIEQVAKLLNYHYFIEGLVVHGAKLGRKIGFPTVNMVLKYCNLPYGVYAVKLRRADGKALDGVASYGLRPTVVDSDQPLLETYLFNFNEEIYGEYVQVSFFKYLRAEQKFASIKEMIAQIKLDEVQAQSILSKQKPICELDQKLCF